MKIIMRGHKEARRLTLKLADGSLVTGMINLIQRGETEHRVSDIFVGREEPFVVIFKATMGDKTNKTFVINKQHIVWVIPEEEEYDDKKEPPRERLIKEDFETDIH
jgi:hypothetical protein